MRIVGRELQLTVTNFDRKCDQQHEPGLLTQDILSSRAQLVGMGCHLFDVWRDIDVHVS